MLTTFTSHHTDISFPDFDLDLRLFRSDPNIRPVEGRFGPALAGSDPSRLADVPMAWRNFTGGGGATQPLDAVEDGYAYAQNACTRYPHLVMPSSGLIEVVVSSPTLNSTTSPLGVTSSAELDGHLYFAAGRYVIKITNGNDAGPIVAADKDFGATIRAYSLLAFDGAIWAGTYNAGATLWKLIAGGGGWTNAGTPPGVKKLETVFWETTDASGVYAGRHEMVGTENATSERTIIHIPAASDPLVGANWSGSLKIGPGTSPINSLVASNRHIFACTSSGVADLDTLGNSPILNPDQARHRDDVINGAASLFHSGYVYFSDVRGICRIDVGSAIRHDENTLCGPGVGLSNETPVFGKAGAGVCPYAFTEDGGWVICSVWNGTDSYICYGRDDGRTDPAGRPIPTWHLGEYYIAGERVTHLRVATPTNEYPRLWICSVTAAGLVKIRWAMLEGAASPLQELLNNQTAGAYSGPRRFVTSAKLYLTGAHWNDDNARKVLLRWDARADRLTTATFLRVFARDEASASFVQQGSGADPKLQISPRSEILPTAAGTGGITIGHAIDVRLDLIGTSTAPPVLRQLQARAEVVAELRDSRTYLIELGEAQSQRNGAIDVSNPDVLWAQLKRLQTNQPVRFIDEMGEELLVRVEPGIGYREQRVRADSGETFRRVLVANLTVSIHATDPADLGLDTSGPITPENPPSANPFAWGDGSLWGSGRTWS